MKLLFLTLAVALLSLPILCHADDSDEGDFAEFEDFDSDDDEFIVGNTIQNDPQEQKIIENDNNDDFVELDDGIVEVEDSEFEHFQDEEEFEGFDSQQPATPSSEQKTGEPKLTMAKVPLHFR